MAARAHREDRAATLTPHLGSVHVEGTPSDATLVLRGSGGDRDVVMGVDLLVPVGAWTLTASAPGHVSRSFDLTVTRDAVERRSIALARIPAPTGRLLVSTGEVVARLSIDGAPRAETPARIDGVEVGRHTISIEAPGFVTWEGELEVSADRPAHISVTLVPR